MWAAWQLSVPAMGLTCLDHFHPGSKVARPTGPPSRLTNSSFPELDSNGRTSSGLSKFILMRLPIRASLVVGESVSPASDGGGRALGSPVPVQRRLALDVPRHAEEQDPEGGGRADRARLAVGLVHLLDLDRQQEQGDEAGEDGDEDADDTGDARAHVLRDVLVA